MNEAMPPAAPGKLREAIDEAMKDETLHPSYFAFNRSYSLRSS